MARIASVKWMKMAWIVMAIVIHENVYQTGALGCKLISKSLKNTKNPTQNK